VTNSETTRALVTRFENGFNARDVDATMADMTEDGGEAALHGVDVITVRAGNVAEKLPYGTL